MKRLCASQTFELPLLQSAQELGLQVHRNIADFIEEQSAMSSQFEAAALLDQRSGEGTLFMPEQFALHQSRRNGRTVQADESSRTSRAPIMNGPGDQFLARTSFAVQKHSGTGRRHDGYLIQHLADTGTLADYILKVVLGLYFCFEIEPLFFQAGCGCVQAPVGKRIIQRER